jgi:hypothetical protein
MGELAAEATEPAHMSLTQFALEAYTDWLKMANVDCQASYTDAAMERLKASLLVSAPYMYKPKP